MLLQGLSWFARTFRFILREIRFAIMLEGIEHHLLDVIIGNAECSAQALWQKVAIEGLLRHGTSRFHFLILGAEYLRLADML